MTTSLNFLLRSKFSNGIISSLAWNALEKDKVLFSRNMFLTFGVARKEETKNKQQKEEQNCGYNV